MITSTYVTFFQGLEQNNHKDWFHANKSAYETRCETTISQFAG